MKSLESDFGRRRIMIHRFLDLARLYFWCLQHLGKVVLAYRRLWLSVGISIMFLAGGTELDPGAHVESSNQKLVNGFWPENRRIQ